MTLSQLHYTSAPPGPGGSGFRFTAVSEDVPQGVLREAEQLIGYEPPRDSPARPDAGELADFPTAFSFSELSDGGRLLSRSVYTGVDYSGRWGNFHAHALHLPAGVRLPDGALPITAWESRRWGRTTPDGGRPEPIDRFEPSGLMRQEALVAFAASRADRLAAVLADVRAVADDPGAGQVVLVERDSAAVAQWIALACAALPREQAHRLTFTTYTRRPVQARQQIIGALPSSETVAYGHRHRVHDCTRPPAPAPAAGAVTDPWAEVCARVWRAGRPELFRHHGPDLGSLAAAALTARIPLPPAALTAATQWVRDRAGSLPEGELAEFVEALCEARPSDETPSDSASGTASAGDFVAGLISLFERLDGQVPAFVSAPLAARVLTAAVRGDGPVPVVHGAAFTPEARLRLGGELGYAIRAGVADPAQPPTGRPLGLLRVADLLEVDCTDLLPDLAARLAQALMDIPEARLTPSPAAPEARTAPGHPGRRTRATTADHTDAVPWWSTRTPPAHPEAGNGSRPGTGQDAAATGPAGPAWPARPTGPAEPTSPSHPGGPERPGGPGGPGGRGRPAGPAQPGGPGRPERPGGPDGPTYPGDPTGLAGSGGPGNPGRPDGPAYPGGPAGLARPGEPAGLTGPGGPGGPVHPGSPAYPAGHGGPAHPGGLAGPGGFGGPGAPAYPAGLAHSAGPANPAGLVHPTEPPSPIRPEDLGVLRDAVVAHPTLRIALFGALDAVAAGRPVVAARMLAVAGLPVREHPGFPHLRMCAAYASSAGAGDRLAAFHGVVRTAGVSMHAEPAVLRTALDLVWPGELPTGQEASLLLNELGSDAHRAAGTRDLLIDAALAAPADDRDIPALAADLLRCFTTELAPEQRAALLLLEFAGLLGTEGEGLDWVQRAAALAANARPVPAPVLERVHRALARRLLRGSAPPGELYALALSGDADLLAAYERVAQSNRVGDRLRTVPGYVADCFCDWSSHAGAHPAWDETCAALLAKVLRPVVRALPAEDLALVESSLDRAGRGKLDAFRAWNRPGTLGRLAGRLTGRGRGRDGGRDGGRDNNPSSRYGDVAPPPGDGRERR
ncbi:GTPase-associated protein 1-related protein [Streptomyces tauricus]|uniref:GTPase-associated protein 1-related protein n=1 Tax=Streptomyces tauricus TaxID=68274 RepID=UPI0033FCB75E